MLRLNKSLLPAFCAVLLLLLPLAAYSDGYYVLDYLDVDYRQNSSVLNINFLVPVNYIQHYPASEGTGPSSADNGGGNDNPIRTAQRRGIHDLESGV